MNHLVIPALQLWSIQAPDPATIHLGHSEAARIGVSFPMEKTDDPLFHRGEATAR